MKAGVRGGGGGGGGGSPSTGLDPRVAEIEKLARQAAATPLDRLPEHVLKSPAMVKWARTIVAILGIERRVGVCFDGESAKREEDKKLQTQPEAKAVMDSWFSGQAAFNRQDLMDSVRMPPSAAPGERSVLANRLLSSYASLRKLYFLTELLAGQQGRTSQRAASAIVKALQSEPGSTAQSEYTRRFLVGAEQIERWYWKSQEAVPSLLLLPEPELQRRSSALLTKSQQRVVCKLPRELVSLLSLREYQRAHPVPRVYRGDAADAAHISRGFRGWSESASNSNANTSNSNLDASEETTMDEEVDMPLGRKRRVMVSDSDDEDNDQAVKAQEAKKQVVERCTPMPHKIDIRSLEQDSTERLAETLSATTRRRRSHDTAGTQEAEAPCWRPFPSAPPALPSETVACELVVDELVIGKVSLRRVASTKAYCVEQICAPRRLFIHTDRIMAVKGCFSELAKLAQWTVNPARGSNPQWLHTFVRERLGAQRGVALAHSRRPYVGMCTAGGEAAAQRDAAANACESDAGCFYFTLRRLYYSPSSDLHSGWEDLPTKLEDGAVAVRENCASVVRSLNREDRLPTFHPATADEIFSVYVGNIASIDGWRILQLLELCGTKLSPIVEWSRNIDPVTGRCSLGIAKYRGPAGAACAMRTLNGLEVALPTASSAGSEVTASDRTTASIQLKVGREQGKKLKQYENEVSRNSDRTLAAGISLRAQFDLARQAVERQLAEWVSRTEQASASLLPEDTHDVAYPQSTTLPADTAVDTALPASGDPQTIVEDQPLPPANNSVDSVTETPAGEATAEEAQESHSDFELARALQAEEDLAFAQEMTSNAQKNNDSPVFERRHLRSHSAGARLNHPLTGNDRPRNNIGDCAHSDHSGTASSSSARNGERVWRTWTNDELEKLWLMIEISGPGDWDSKAEMLGTGRTGRALMSKFYARRGSVVTQSNDLGQQSDSQSNCDDCTPIGQGEPEGDCTSGMGSSNENSSNTSGVCSICMSVALEPVETPCRHTFCTDCISYWLNQKEAGTMKRCPTCRQGLRQFSRQLSFNDQLPAAWRDEGDDQKETAGLRVGQRVLADFGEYGTYYSGVVATTNSDGTFGIAYDDGDAEDAVKRTSIQIPDDSIAVAPTTSLAAPADDRATNITGPAHR